MKDIVKIAKSAQIASRLLVALSTATKNRVLKDMALALLRQKKAILAANCKDIALGVRVGLSKAMLDRLALSQKRLQEMADSLLALVKLRDPVGETIKSWTPQNGLKIKKVRVPIGVVAIIYEARPNVTSDCIGLCFKAGNSLILKGGSEALHSNQAIYQALKAVLEKYHLPEAAINLIESRERKAVDALLKLNDYIDLVIPRGGEGLIRRVVELSRIPVIKHYKGICHVYVDKKADLKKAQEICFNAKVQRPGVCNAMESMLVHQDVAAKFLPLMLKRFQGAGVQIRGCSRTARYAKNIRRATAKDYATEYLNLILSVKVVNNLDEAIEHINHFGSHHSDSIVTEDKQAAQKFLKHIDSACVYANASTRFTDGYQFGMGAEIGISTDKLHARGPMALEELTTYKYIIVGSGQVRS